MEAVGGKSALLAITGYRDEYSVEIQDAPPSTAVTTFQLPDRLVESRRILSTEIETSIAGEQGEEHAGTAPVQLSIDEIQARLMTAGRHPLLVLRGWLRGDMQFRLLALRMSGDREVAVLEQVDAGADTLRLTIDTGAGLIRAMELRPWSPESGRIAVIDEFLDYRTVGGRLRTPFYRTRTQEDRACTTILRTTAVTVLRGE